MDRRRAARAALALLCSAMLVPAGSASAAGCADETLQPGVTNIVKVRAATLCLINQERGRVGRKPLASSPALVRAAQSHSERMVRERFFDHVGPDRSTVLTRVRSLTSYLRGTVRYALGENLAWGSWDLATPQETVRSWMESAGHRGNLLSQRFRHVGIGVATGAPAIVDGPAATYTTVFGQRTAR